MSRRQIGRAGSLIIKFSARLLVTMEARADFLFRWRGAAQRNLRRATIECAHLPLY